MPHGGETPGRSEVPDTAESSAPGIRPTLLTLEQIERRAIVERLREFGQGNKEAVAKSLGISLGALYYKLKKHGLAAKGRHG